MGIVGHVAVGMWARPAVPAAQVVAKYCDERLDLGELVVAVLVLEGFLVVEVLAVLVQLLGVLDQELETLPGIVRDVLRSADVLQLVSDVSNLCVLVGLGVRERLAELLDRRVLGRAARATAASSPSSPHAVAVPATSSRLAAQSAFFICESPVR